MSNDKPYFETHKHQNYLNEKPWIDRRLNEEEINFLRHAISKENKKNYSKELAGNISKSELIDDKNDWFYKTTLKKLTENIFLVCDEIQIVDISVFPFLRQYANIDKLKFSKSFSKLNDYLAIKFQGNRGYSAGLLPLLERLEKLGKIELIKVRRLFFGSLYMEGYNTFVWKKVN